MGGGRCWGNTKEAALSHSLHPGIGVNDKYHRKLINWPLHNYQNIYRYPNFDFCGFICDFLTYGGNIGDFGNYQYRYRYQKYQGNYWKFTNIKKKDLSLTPSHKGNRFFSLFQLRVILLLVLLLILRRLLTLFTQEELQVSLTLIFFGCPGSFIPAHVNWLIDWLVYVVLTLFIWVRFFVWIRFYICKTVILTKYNILIYFVNYEEYHSLCYCWNILQEIQREEMYCRNRTSTHGQVYIITIIIH